MSLKRISYSKYAKLSPPPGDLTDPGIKSTSLMSHALAQEFFTTSTTWEALLKRDIISNRLFCCCSVVKSCPTLCNPCTAAHQAPLSFTISWSLSKLMSTELMMLSYHLILCHSLLLLPSIFPASWSFQMSQLFASRGQHIGASASALPMNIQD